MVVSRIYKVEWVGLITASMVGSTFFPRLLDVALSTFSLPLLVVTPLAALLHGIFADVPVAASVGVPGIDIMGNVFKQGVNN